MRRFKKALALIVIILVVMYFFVYLITKDAGFPGAREKRYDNFRIDFIVDKQPVTGQQVNFGYHLELMNESEIKSMQFIKSVNILKDGSLINVLPPPLKMTKGIQTRFNQSGEYHIITSFISDNVVIDTDFIIDVKSKKEYEEDKVKGALFTVIGFVLVTVFFIYLYEKLEKD